MSATTSAPKTPGRTPVDVDSLPETRFKQLKRAGREVFGRVVTSEARTSVRCGRVYVTTESSVGPPQRDVIEADVDLGLFEVLLPRGRRAVHAHFIGDDAYEDCDMQMPGLPGIAPPWAPRHSAARLAEPCPAEVSTP